MALSFIMIFSLVACAAPKEEDIIGTWAWEDPAGYAHVIEFSAENKSWTNGTKEGFWEIDGSKVILYYGRYLSDGTRRVDVYTTLVYKNGKLVIKGTDNTYKKIG